MGIQKVSLWANTGPSYFQMLVNKVLEGLDFTFGYLDDILIYSKNMEEHLQHVRILFE